MTSSESVEVPPKPVTELEVLVIGAGPAGLLATLLLKLRGVNVRVVDSKTELSPLDKSKAIAVHAPTLHLFHALGMLDRFMEYTLKLKGTVIHGSNGAVMAEIPVGEVLTDATPFPFVAATSQGITERVIHERLVQLGGRVEWGVEATLRSPGDVEGADSVEVQLSTGELVRASFVIAADGAHSPVRKALGVEFHGRAYTERFILADLVLGPAAPAPADPSGAAAAAPLRGDRVHIFLGDHVSHMVFPLAGPFPAGTSADLPARPSAGADAEGDGGRIYMRVVAVDRTQGGSSVDAHGISRAPITPAEATEELAPFLRTLGRTVESMLWVARFGVNSRMASHLQVGRVALVGDAAHIHSPAGGHGMNTGFADVANVTWKIALALRGAAPAGLVATYEVERRQIVGATIANTDRLLASVSMDNFVARALRDFALPLVTGLRFVQRTAALNTCMLAYAYPPGPLVHGTHSLVGRAIPHCRLLRGSRACTLLDACGSAVTAGFLVLVLGDSHHAAAATAARFGGAPISYLNIAPQNIAPGAGRGAADVGGVAASADERLIDAYGDLAKALGAAQRLIVRPDLYVAAVGQAGQDDVEYFSNVFP